jgi:hypothetical protein
VNGERTRVGIVQWGARTAGARAAEQWLAASLGARIAAAAPAEKPVLARRARVHGWHADLWKSVVPLLPDVETLVEDRVGGVADDEVDSVFAGLEDAYRLWTEEASPIAEAPILRVLELIARDHEAGLAPDDGP